MALKDKVVKALWAGVRSADPEVRRPSARSEAAQPDTTRDRRWTRKGTSSRTRRATPVPATAELGAATPDVSRVENSRSADARASSTEDNHGYLGEHNEPVEVSYGPAEDGNADPGEVVWTWVPYEEDRTHGKYRPVLVIARRGRQVLGVMMSSRDPDEDADDDARRTARPSGGQVWHDVGSGPWDSLRRGSEVRLDRVMVFDPAGIRREGARLDEERFDALARALRRAPS